MTTPEFVEIGGGPFAMGAADGPHPEDGEGPVREVHLDKYRISKCAVSNADFARFVDETGHVTLAELQGTSQVFSGLLEHPGDHPVSFADTPWWRNVAGAYWRRPNGTVEAPADHPVVHIAYQDACAYCHWSNTRLPTEAEWERAAQGSAQVPLNIWQGAFPDRPTAPPGTWAVDNARPNGQGLYHACGNVWEWTADGFGRLHSPRTARNPKGNLGTPKKVVKGGSYLCAPSYCARYRPSSRRWEHPDASTGHLGFRVVKA